MKNDRIISDIKSFTIALMTGALGLVAVVPPSSAATAVIEAPAASMVQPANSYTAGGTSGCRDVCVRWHNHNPKLCADWVRRCAG